jgi:DNA-binding transcriptional ArsR family regulator
MSNVLRHATRKKRPDLTDEAFELIASRFKMLAEPMRLKILHTLDKEEKSVTELVEQTGAGQANISKHLALMLDAGIVARRKEGSMAHYRIADQTIFDLCEVVCTRLGERLAKHQQVIRTFGG